MTNRARELLDHFARTDIAHGPRTLLIVAHPDDETIGAGGRLAAIDPAAIVIVTDGAPRDPWFARAASVRDRESHAALRRHELEAALAAGQVPLERLSRWGFVDQEAALELDILTRAVRTACERLWPDVVMTHPYEGGHPDHDAAAFAVHAARRMLPPARRPVILELAYYHQGPYGPIWGQFTGSDPGRAVVLRGQDLARKRAMVARYRSQAAVLARFPLHIERLRAAPDYDFSVPPPAHGFHYDAFGWPITGHDFVQHAAALWREL